MVKKIFIVIPAFNEEKNIGKVINELKSNNYKNIIVVDDGSEDNTFEAASKTDIDVVKHIVNRGQGAALQTGISYALQKDADIIVTFDSDGQHRLEDIPAMINPIEQGLTDVTFGSRFLKKTKVPFLRKILLKGSILILFFFYRLKMSDAHNGLRALSRDAAKKINITCDKMAHASEIIEEVHRKKLKFQEIPVTIRYSDETMKKGHGSYIGAVKILAEMIFKKFIR